jgi:hypothetical protein
MLVTAPLPPQVRQDRLRHPQRAEEVRLQLRAGLRLGELLHHAQRHEPRVVDHHVQAAEVRDRAVDGRVHGVPVGDVQREREQPLLGDRLDRPGHRDHPIARRERRVGERPAEPPARAGDEPRAHY